MFKIGILTHFYKSKNYGGVLQAYALVSYVNASFMRTEQICYKSNTVNFSLPHKEDNKKIFLRYFSPKKILRKLVFFAKKNKLALRYNAFEKFYEYIPHSENVFNKHNVKNSTNNYDIFITGSDQVWNMTWFDPNYFLEFVPDEKKKIAYAVSMGHSSLTEEQKDYLKRVLPTFTAISVREKDMVDLLQPLTDKKIEWVLDPTLLLDKGDWDEICPERRIKEKYLFCYFLGHDERIRKLAKKHAKKNNLKIVNLPHLCGIAKADIGFGNYKLYDVAPNDFISLIKYADCVFTDSFHACVFSGIYNKNFVAFNRHGMESMATRIYSLCELFECRDHFCDCEEKFNIDYIGRLEPIDYNKDFTLLKEMKERSIDFLKNNLS